MVCAWVSSGAGTGQFTRELVPQLYGNVYWSPMIKYVATDISPGFGPALLDSLPYPGFTYQVGDNKAHGSWVEGHSLLLPLTTNTVMFSSEHFCFSIRQRSRLHNRVRLLAKIGQRLGSYHRFVVRLSCLEASLGSC